VKKVKIILFRLLLFSSIGCNFFLFLRNKYISSDLETIDFLSRSKNIKQVIDQYGEPSEIYFSEEKIKSTGWSPIPKRAVTGKAFSFILKYTGSKVYIFTDFEGNIESFYLSKS